VIKAENEIFYNELKAEVIVIYNFNISKKKCENLTFSFLFSEEVLPVVKF